MSEFKTPRSLCCPFHDETRSELRPLPRPDSIVGELLAPCTHIALDWPICARVRCFDCGHAWYPMRRAAVVRRHPVCPHCGSRSILEQELIRTIEYGSRWSGCTAAALGLPENHLYTVRVSRG